MPLVVQTYGGLEIAVLAFAHEWSVSFALSSRFPSPVTAGRTDREARRLGDEALRHALRTHLVLDGQEAQDFRQALAVRSKGWIGVPLWNDRLPGAAWADRVFSAQALYDFSAGAIIAADATLSADALYAPLLVGHLVDLPPVKALTDETAELTFTLTEDSPWDFRVGIAAELEPGTWPSTLIPNWLDAPEDQPSHGLEFDQIGEIRESIIEGVEKPFKWGQEAGFLLGDRGEIRTLYAFFVASQGRRKAFTSPWWLNPGTPTAEAPASTTARFASDVLSLEFSTDGVATARVGVVQVPWEIVGVEGEEPEQPARIFLYKFTHALPEPQVYRSTNWPRPLTRAGDGTYLPKPTKHQEFNEGLDLRSEEVTLDSFIFAGNPLGLFTPLVLEAKLKLEIREVETDPIDPDAATLRWVGAVKAAPQKGRRITAKAVFLAGMLDRQLPNVLNASGCQVQIFSGPCGLLKADFAQVGTLTTSAGHTITVTTAAADAAQIYAPGWIEVGTGAAWEQRSILASTPITGGQQFVIERPLRQTAAGQAVTFYRGCDGTVATCQSLGAPGSWKTRYRGAPHLSQVNLSFPRVTTDTPTGKK